MKHRYQIELARSIKRDLEHIERKFHSIIYNAILEQLCFEPLTETRNRKPLDPAILNANWELRCGVNNQFRVL